MVISVWGTYHKLHWPEICTASSSYEVELHSRTKIRQMLFRLPFSPFTLNSAFYCILAANPWWRCLYEMASYNVLTNSNEFNKGVECDSRNKRQQWTASSILCSAFCLLIDYTKRLGERHFFCPAHSCCFTQLRIVCWVINTLQLVELHPVGPVFQYFLVPFTTLDSVSSKAIVSMLILQSCRGTVCL